MPFPTGVAIPIAAFPVDRLRFGHPVTSGGYANLVSIQ